MLKSERCSSQGKISEDIMGKKISKKQIEELSNRVKSE